MWDLVVEHVRKEWRVVRQAPFTLALCIVLGVGAGYWGTSRLYEQRIDILHDLLAANGSLPQPRPTPTPRHLSDDASFKLAQSLVVEGTVRIVRQNNPESSAYAEDFETAFRRAGWRIETVLASPGQVDLPRNGGIFIYGNHHFVLDTEAILSGIGIQTYATVDDKMPPNEIELRIGQQPK